MKDRGNSPLDHALVCVAGDRRKFLGMLRAGAVAAPLLALFYLFASAFFIGCVTTQSVKITAAGSAGHLISGFTECPNNPVLETGNPGDFDAGSVRDGKIWYARGSYWQLYTGAASATSPYSPTIGIAYSSDGCLWRKGGQIIVPNPKMTRCAGGVFSPGAYYDAPVDVLYVYPSCAATPEDWYSGPIYIAQMHAGAGKSWTSPSSYAWDYGGIPVLSAGQDWEGTQGVYAGDVSLVNGTYYMFYSSNTGGVLYQVGIATARSPSGPWTKSASNPITSSTTNFEEPAIAQLGNGDIVLFGDDVGIALHGINVAVGNGDAITTAAGWHQQPIFEFPDTELWSLAEIGSQSIVEAPDGRWLMCYDGMVSGSVTDARTIGCARLSLDSIGF
ncbi:MAG TPA: family 43 glycosylhydrolase [Terracidiphilus sp.]|jgi:beta-xylosidase|nr:family 43 glycosylhydrolase [Terracidiphilus sp.]